MGQGGFSVGGMDKMIEKTEGEKESKGLSDDFMDSGGPCWIAAEIYGGWYELRTIEHKINLDSHMIYGIR